MKRTLIALALFCITSPAWALECKISEYQSLATDAQGREIQVALEPRVTSQTVTYTVSAQSAPFNNITRFIRVVCNARAHFRISVAGTNATVNDPFIPADSPEYFGIQPGQSLVIDFYDGTS